MLRRILCQRITKTEFAHVAGQKLNMSVPTIMMMMVPPWIGLAQNVERVERLVTHLYSTSITVCRTGMGTRSNKGEQV